LLDSHASELKQSEFAHEAMVLRLEALLDLKRSGEALALLDSKSLSNVAASHTLLLTRARASRRRMGPVAQFVGLPVRGSTGGGQGRWFGGLAGYFNSSSRALASARSGSSCSARLMKMMARALSWDLWAMRPCRK
jgi:hypothetical protein